MSATAVNKYRLQKKLRSTVLAKQLYLRHHCGAVDRDRLDCVNAAPVSVTAVARQLH